MKKTALVVLAEGFEEIEAITPIDILRRAEVDVTIAGVGSTSITAAHGVTVQADIILSDYKDTPDAIILPGGLPGAENLATSVKLKDLLKNLAQRGKLIAAICASPALVLSPMGLLEGKEATCYPGMEKNFSTNVKFSNEKVIQDGNIITSRGPATAFLFGLKIAENLVGKPKADMLASQMVMTE